jgi:activator of HSP90 ATPase
MARWGERDARWVVQEREDGSNVRGWHWEEKNAMSWTKERLAELLTDLSTTAGPAAVKVTQVKSITGEVRNYRG